MINGLQNDIKEMYSINPQVNKGYRISYMKRLLIINVLYYFIVKVQYPSQIT